jgi:AraC family transcriptional regulator, transcriptional activator of pobA
MQLTFKNKQTNAVFLLTINENYFDRAFFTRDREQKYLTIAWNRSETQKILVDEIEYDYPEN